jgi:hypothetical protein
VHVIKMPRKVCFKFQKQGKCGNGDGCRFLHGDNDPRYVKSEAQEAASKDRGFHLPTEGHEVIKLSKTQERKQLKLAIKEARAEAKEAAEESAEKLAEGAKGADGMFTDPGAPPPARKQQQEDRSDDRGEICRDFTRGLCSRGTECRFDHPPQQQEEDRFGQDRRDRGQGSRSDQPPRPSSYGGGVPPPPPWLAHAQANYPHPLNQGNFSNAPPPGLVYGDPGPPGAKQPESPRKNRRLMLEVQSATIAQITRIDLIILITRMTLITTHPTIAARFGAHTLVTPL